MTALCGTGGFRRVSGGSGCDDTDDVSGDGVEGEHIVEDTGLGTGTRHAVDDAGSFIFAESVASGVIDGRHPVLPIATHAGEDDSHDLPRILVGGGEHEDIYGRDVRSVRGHGGHVREGAGATA